MGPTLVHESHVLMMSQRISSTNSFFYFYFLVHKQEKIEKFNKREGREETTALDGGNPRTTSYLDSSHLEFSYERSKIQFFSPPIE